MQYRVTQSQYVTMSGIIMVRLSTYDGIEPDLTYFTADRLVSPFGYHVPFTDCEMLCNEENPTKYDERNEMIFPDIKGNGYSKRHKGSV